MFVTHLIKVTCMQLYACCLASLNSASLLRCSPLLGHCLPGLPGFVFCLLLLPSMQRCWLLLRSVFLLTVFDVAPGESQDFQNYRLGSMS